MQVRDGPAAVEGRCPPPRRHWPCLPSGRGREGGGGGAPSQKTCRPPTIRTPRGRRIRREAPSRNAPGGACRRDRRVGRVGESGTAAAAPKRIISLSPTATETLFAIGAGKQVIAVDDQSDYPKSAPKTNLSGFTPNVEAVAAYHPDLVVISYSPKDFAGALAKAAHPRARAGRRRTLQGRVRPDDAARRVRPATSRRRALVVAHEGAHRKDRQAAPEKAAVRLPRARRPTTTRPRRRRSSADLSTLRPEEHRRRAPAPARAPAALGRVHRRLEPRPDRPCRHALLRPEPREGSQRGRSGATIAAVKKGARSP